MHQRALISYFNYILSAMNLLKEKFIGNFNIIILFRLLQQLIAFLGAKLLYKFICDSLTHKQTHKLFFASSIIAVIEHSLLKKKKKKFLF